MLDSNIVGPLMNSNTRVRKRYNAILGSAAISVIVLSELLYGIAKSKNRKANTLGLDRLLQSGLLVAAFTEDDAATAGTLRATLAAGGDVMAQNDLLIAAQALRVGATLVTAGSDFARVDGLITEDWSKP